MSAKLEAWLDSQEPDEPPPTMAELEAALDDLINRAAWLSTAAQPGQDARVRAARARILARIAVAVEGCDDDGLGPEPSMDEVPYA